MEIEIDLSKTEINRRIPRAREELLKWLLENNSFSLQSLELDIADKGGSLENIFGGLSILDIEIETAIGLARRGNMEDCAYVMANAKKTKDFIYDNLIETYGGIKEIVSKGVKGDMVIWRDYILDKYNGGLRQVEFLLANKR